MGKWQNDLALDASCDWTKNNVTQEIVCSEQPTSHAEATTTYKIASKTGLTSADFTGPLDGDVSGRKITVNAQNTAPATATATGTHIALCNDTILIRVTTMTSQAITTGNVVAIPAWDIEFEDVKQ